MSNYQRIKISLTNDCNLNCAHCYMEEKEKIYIKTELLFKRIDEAKNLGVKVIDLTGGEPTLHPDFIDIVEYIGQKGFSVHLCTNGLLLSNPAIMTVINKYKVRCNISLDGISEETVISIRGTNILKELEPIFYFLKENDVPFTLRFSLNKNNINELKSILVYSEKIHPLGVLVNVTQLRGNATANIILDADDIIKAKSIIEEMAQNLSIIFSECFTKPEICDGGFPELLSLTTTGKPVGCFMIPETYVNDISDDMSLKELWDEVKSIKFRLKNFKMHDKCIFCQYKLICESGCLVTAAAMGCLRFD